MDIASIEAIQRLLTKEVLKENLGKAGLYLLAWELLQDAIIGPPKRFFTMGGWSPTSTTKGRCSRSTRKAR
jgi:hypothetical protein